MRASFVLVLVLVCFAGKTWAALNATEVTALEDFYAANKNALSDLFPAWDTDPTNVCELSAPWYGIVCLNGHVDSLSLSQIQLGGSIPDSIGGLSSARSILLRGCGLSGTVPSSLQNISTLVSLDLSNNGFNLCASEPLVLSATCALTGQTASICANNSCCGCDGAWKSAFSCSTNIPNCANCTGSAPVEYPNATCSNGYYVIPNSWTGGLTLRGKSAVLGDLTVPIGNTLAFEGFSSFLNVTGRVVIKSYAVIIAATDSDANTLKALGRTALTVPYMYSNNPNRQAGTFTGSNSLITVHTKRACRKPFVSTSPVKETDYNNWIVSVRYYNGCNTWWIIVLCMSPVIIGFGIGILSVVGESIAKSCC